MGRELINVFKQKQMVSIGLAECSLGPEEAPAVADMIRVIPSLTDCQSDRGEPNKEILEYEICISLSPGLDVPLHQDILRNIE